MKEEVMTDLSNINKTYAKLLDELKEKIRSSQIKAALAVNTELICLYWEIGKILLNQQQQEGWGTKVIERLAHDLKTTFPDISGFSPRNLNYMKKLAEIYPDREILQQAAAKIPWGHNMVLIDKLDTLEERLWYAQKTTEHGWSRNILSMQIETKLYHRQGKTITNFEKRLSSQQSDLARQVLKDPYIFDFLSVGQEAHEREIENALVQHITKFLLELGTGFAFVGQQYHLEVGGDDFFVDLLFYHLKLRCYVVIDLKANKFKPEYAGQINFYLSVVDDLLRHPSDNPSIGILLCRDKNKLVAEYALKDVNKPIGVSAYQLLESVPENLKTSLPSIEELEAELESIEDKES
jgi:predicted nuclease of restriction endonuclease-like (RecB) superfamily